MTISERLVAFCLSACAGLHAQDWPTVGGSDLDGRLPVPEGKTTIDGPGGLRLLWRSEARIQPTYGVDGRSAKALRNAFARIGSGYSAPLIHDGKVYLYHHRPGGDAHDRDTADKSLAQGGWGRSVWTVNADAVALCIDLADGSTVYRRIFDEVGPNIEAGFNKGGGHFLSWIEDGRWYVFAPDCRIRCLDAGDGRLLWEAPIGMRTRSMGQSRRLAHDQGELQFYNRVLGPVHAVGGGILAIPCGREDHGLMDIQGGNGLTGLDAETGVCRWYRPGLGGSPTVWRHGQETSFLVEADRDLVCVDAANGATRWRLEDVRLPSGSRIDGDRVLATRGDGIVCVGMSAAAGEILWTAPGALDLCGWVRVGEHYCAIDPKGKQLRSLRRDTGEVAGTMKAWNPEHMGVVAVGNLLLAPERKGVHFVRVGDDGGLADLGMAELPIATCTMIAVADGIMVVRTDSRLHAYSLLTEE